MSKIVLPEEVLEKNLFQKPLCFWLYLSPFFFKLSGKDSLGLENVHIPNTFMC